MGLSRYRWGRGPKNGFFKPFASRCVVCVVTERAPAAIVGGSRVERQS